MKQLIASLALALLLPASALALSPSEKLEDFNNWLQANDQYGINYINSQLKQTKATAHQEWDDRAALYDLTLGLPAEQDLYCEILLTSQNIDENDYKGSCTDGETPLTELIENNPDIDSYLQIYRVDYLLRDMIPALMADDRAMPLLDSLLGQNAMTSLEINLAKNEEHQPVWTLTFIDDEAGTSYLVKTSALEKEERDFLVLGNNTSL